MAKAIGASPVSLTLPSGTPSTSGLGERFAPDLYRGTGNMSVPIDLPPGVNGVTPELVLTYSSGHGNGPLGIGFSMAQMNIQRSLGDGVPTYQEGDVDRFQISGSDVLVPVGGGRYRPATEQRFWHIFRSDQDWLVTTQDGTTHQLGSTENSRISDPSDPTRVYGWLIDLVRDANGIEVRYEYLEDRAQRYLAKIEYAIFTVEFEYDDVRPDAFTTRRSGFEITTAKRLVQIRILSDRDNQRHVLRRYDLSYSIDPLRQLSLLAEIKLSAGSGADYREMPTLTMDYSLLDLSISTPGAKIFSSQSATTELPNLNDPNVSLIDLAGDGLPDVVASTPVGMLIWKNLGAGQWAAPQVADDLPGQIAIGDAKLQFADLSGNGTVDLLIQDGANAGILENDAGGTWQQFRAYPDGLPFDITDSELRLVDMDGDGRVDAVRAGNNSFDIYKNLGDEGWDLTPTRVPRVHDKASFPDVFFSDPHVFLADMTGDGLTDIVEVRDRYVAYWPYLGHGRYGAREIMADAPDLPAGHRIEDVSLVDLAGDGTSDVVLIEPDRMTVWLNHDGRGFSTAIIVDFGSATRGAKPYLIDALASGRKGLLFNKPVQGGTLNRYGFKQIGQGNAPFLMTSIQNGMGATTRMTYASVEEMRGPARRAGRDWNTFLPFPQQVIRKIEVTDDFVSTIAEATFSYADGHYDGNEREFRGFARVSEEEAGDVSSPRILREHSFDVGDDLTITEAERRKLPLSERKLTRAMSGLPTKMVISTRPESGGNWTERERVGYSWISDVVIEDPNSPVVAPLRRSVMNIELALAGPARAELDEVLDYDDQGNKILSKVSFGTFDGAFQPHTQELTETRYAVGARQPDGWQPRAIGETKVLGASGELVRHTRHYYDGPAHVGLLLGELNSGNLTRIEECLFANDSAILDIFPEADLADLGFHQSNDSSGLWRNSVSFARDEAGRALESRDTMGNTHSLEYDSAGVHVIRVTDPLGFIYEAQIDPKQEAINAIKNPSGHAEVQSFDALGRVVAISRTADDGQLYCESAIRHDNAVLDGEAKRPAQIITITPAKRVSYEEAAAFFDSMPSDLVDVRKSVQRYCGVGQEIERRASREPDSLGQSIVTLSGTKSLTVHGELSAAGRPRTANSFDWDNTVETLPTEPVFQFRYDHRKRTIEASEPGGKRRITTIDPWFTEQHDVVASRGFLSRVRREEYCPRGRQKRLIEDAGAIGTDQDVEFGHTSSGAVKEIRVGGALQFRQITALNGLVIQNWNADAGVRSFLYDAAGNLVRSRDAIGVELENTYDALNRLITTRVVGQTDPVRRFFYDHDPQRPSTSQMIGRLARVEDEAGSQSYEYNTRGLIVSLTRETKNGPIMRMEYLHNELGKLAQIRYPDGSLTDYTYNEADLLTGVSNVVDDVRYNTEGQPIGITFANGLTSTRHYDSNLQLISDDLEDGSGLATGAYKASYDEAGHISTVVLGGPSEISRKSFQYDPLMRLTDTIGNSEQSLSYDGKGNILTKSDLGFAVFEYSDPQGPSRLTRHPTPSGDVRMRYDEAGRVVEHERVGRISYDVWGRPGRCETPSGEVIEYEFGYGDALVARHVTDASGNKQSSYFQGQIYEETEQERVCAILADGQLVARRVTDANGRTRTITHHTDLQGTVYLMTDERGQSIVRQQHDPWGQPDDPSQPSFYIGRTAEEELGVVLLGTRFYDPAIGRFLSPDDLVLNRPEGFSHGSQLLNPYVYGINNPVRFRDRSGRFVWLPILIGAAVGAFIGYQTAKEHGQNPWAGALIGGLIGGLTGGYGGWAMLKAASISAAISGGLSVAANGGKIGPYFWTSVGVGFAFGAIGHAVPQATVAGKGAWVTTQNIALEVGRSALLSGAQAAVNAHLTDEDVWDAFAKGALTGGLITGAKIAVFGVQYDALAGPDPQKHGFAERVYDRYQADHLKDNSKLAGQIAKEKVPNVNSGLFRRGGLIPRINGGRSMVFGSNVVMAPGQEYNVNILAHELRHVHQIQLHGGFASFMLEYSRQYMSEAWDHAYEDSILNTTYEVFHRH